MPKFTHKKQYEASKEELWNWYNSPGAFRRIMPEWEGIKPVQVGSLTDWLTISGDAVMWSAVKTNGTLWGIGRNDYGGLGDGSTTNRSSPVQIGALTTWKKANLDTGHSSTVGGIIDYA